MPTINVSDNLVLELRPARVESQRPLLCLHELGADAVAIRLDEVRRLVEALTEAAVVLAPESELEDLEDTLSEAAGIVAGEVPGEEREAEGLAMDMDFRLGYVRLDQPGDLQPEDDCPECGQAYGDGGIWLAIMADGRFFPLCAACVMAARE